MSISVFEAQKPLRAQYKASPATATVTSEAFTGDALLGDPFRSRVRPKDPRATAVPFGVHRSVGSPYDLPCPGDLLCAALAACQDASIRMVADLLGVELEALEVQVRGTLDVRGALGLDANVPVGYQAFHTDVHFKAREGTPPELLDKLRHSAERCCVVAQTLRTPPAMSTTFHG